MSNLYDRADIYDVCSTPRDWRIIREHWEKALGDDLPRTLLDVPFGKILLTLIALGLVAFGVFCFFRARSPERT